MTTSQAGQAEERRAREGAPAGDRIRVALSVAGLDPSGGAGIIADLRTFEALGVFGTAVATTLTYQNTWGVSGRHDLPPGVVAGQLEAVLSDFLPHAMKTGALGRPDTIEAVARVILEHEVFPVVMDPVFASSDGKPLIGEGGVAAFVGRLLPLAALVTPNQRELEAICGFDTFDLSDVRAAAVWVIKQGAHAVLVTGVPLEQDGAMCSADVLFDGGEFEVFTSPWVEGLRVHGTGCVLSAAAAGYLAKGFELREAVSLAREAVARAIAGAVNPGSGVPCARPDPT